MDYLRKEANGEYSKEEDASRKGRVVSIYRVFDDTVGRDFGAFIDRRHSGGYGGGKVNAVWVESVAEDLRGYACCARSNGKSPGGDELLEAMGKRQPLDGASRLMYSLLKCL